MTNGSAQGRADGAVATAERTAVRVPATAPAVGKPRRRARRTAGPPEAGSAGLDTSVRVSTTAVLTQPTRPTEVTQPTAATPDLVAPQTDGAKPARSHKKIVLRVVAALLVVALVAATGWSAWTVWNDSRQDAKRQSYVDTARQTILNLTTIHPDTAKEDVERLVAGSSGQFRDEFADRQEPFVSVVQDAEVTTDGEIIAAGYEADADDGGTVLVAARAMVSSAEQPEPEPRDFRMRVTIADDDGNLTASKVEFVP